MLRVMPKASLNVLRSIKLCVVLTILNGLSACTNHDDHDHPNLKSGEALFNYHCEDCHGANGTGKLVSQTPANILTERGRDGIINYVTTHASPQRKMPVFSTMPYSEATAIANHLRVLQQRYEALPLNQKKPQELMIKP